MNREICNSLYESESQTGIFWVFNEMTQHTKKGAELRGTGPGGEATLWYWWWWEAGAHQSIRESSTSQGSIKDHYISEDRELGHLADKT